MKSNRRTKITPITGVIFCFCTIFQYKEDSSSMTKARNAIIGTGAKITLHQLLQPIFKICAPFCSYFNFRKCCLKFDAVEAVAYL